MTLATRRGRRREDAEQPRPMSTEERAPAAVALEQVSKVYPGNRVAVVDLSLQASPGEFLVLLGPSGSGKTTVLRLIAGLERVTSGEVVIDGQLVTRVDPARRGIAMVFQSYALYPHMSVRRNIEFGLRHAGLERAEIAARVQRAASMLDLTEVLDYRPRTLSGGQRQRVAMARAIVRQARIWLMDEPLSNLDANLRLRLRAEVKSLQRDLGATTLYVTHDQAEAMTMGDRVAVIHGGRLQQVASPDVIYQNPANLFVAGFVGSPPMNLIESTVARRDGALVLDLGPIHITPHADRLTRLSVREGSTVVVGLRPEDLLIDPEGPLHGVARLVEPLGSETIVHVAVEGTTVRASDRVDPFAEGGRENAAKTPSGELLVRCSPRRAVHPGERLSLSLDPERVRVFDAGSGEAI